MKYSLMILLLIITCSLFPYEENVGEVVPGEIKELNIALNEDITEVINTCSCFKKVDLDVRSLRIQLLIENKIDFFPKRILLRNKNKEIREIMIYGDVKEILPEINYFNSSSCLTCERVNSNIHKRLHGKVYVNEYNIDDKDNLQYLMSLGDLIEQKYYFPNTIVYKKKGEIIFVNGEQEIQKFLSEKIDFKDFSKIDLIDARVNHDDIINDIHFCTIITAGLVDGINPCAFSTIIFLISIMFYFKIEKKNFVIICSAFIIGIFTTYLLIGSGLIAFLSFIYSNITLKRIFDYVILLGIAFVMVINLIDIIRYTRTRSTNNQIVQLSKKQKQRIHELFRNKINNKSTFISVLFLGVIVSLVESICTGQIYIPILRIIIKEDISFSSVLYLIIYNIMFVTPLVLISIVLYYAKEKSIVKELYQKYYLQTKITILVLLAIISYLILDVMY